MTKLLKRHSIMQFLVETALLTHGLRSITNNELLNRWPYEDKFLCWVENGEIVIDNMTRYLDFRKRSDSLIRIDCDHLDQALGKRMDGALTASGTMAVCQKLGIPMAISCGIGGIGDIIGEEICPDLYALERMDTALLCTSPKDMLDIPQTVSWLTERGVHVAGSCTGYIFHSIDLPLSEGLADYPKDRILDPTILADGLLLLNPIPEYKRVADLSILSKAIAVGKEAEACGRYYHPAVNGEIDRLTGGESSSIQLDSLIDNIAYAMAL